MPETGPVTLTFTGRVKPLTSAVSAASGRLFAFQRRIAGVRNALVGMSKKAVLFGGLGAAMIGGKSVKMAADFSREMTRIENLVGINRDLVSEWRNEILGIATATGEGPDKLAEALFRATSGGLRGAEALELVEQSAKASAIGMGDTAQIARAATAAVEAFGSSGLDTKRALEIMIATVRRGNLEVGDLIQAFGTVNNIASNLGITFQDVGAFLANVTRSGMSARRVATSLRAVLGNLLDPAEQAKEAFMDMGLGDTKEDAAAAARELLRNRGLVEGLRSLNEMAQSNDLRLSDFISRLRGLSGALSVVGPNMEAFRKDLAAMESSVGILARTFERIQEEPGFQFDQMASMVKVAAIQIGRNLLPTVIDLVNTLKENRDLLGGIVVEGLRVAMEVAARGLRTLVSAAEGVLQGKPTVGLGIMGFIMFGSKGPTGTIALAFATLDTILETVARKMRETDSELFAGVLGFATGGPLGGFSAAVSKVLQEAGISAPMEMQAGAVEKLAGSFDGAQESVVNFIESELRNVETTTDLTSFLAELANKLDEGADSMKNISTSAGRSTETVQQYGVAWSRLLPDIDSVLDRIQAAITLTQRLAGAEVPVPEMPSVSELARQIPELSRRALSDRFQDAVQQIAEVKTFGTEFTQAQAKELQRLLKTLFDKGMISQDLFDAWSAFITQNTKEETEEGISRAERAVVSAAKRLGNQIGQAIADGVEDMDDFLEATLSGLVQAAAQAGAAALAMSGNFIGAAGLSFAGSLLSGVFGGLLGSPKFQTFYWGQDLATQMVRGMETKQARVTRAAGQMFGLGTGPEAIRQRGSTLDGAIFLDREALRPGTRHRIATDLREQEILDEMLEANERRGGKVSEFSKKTDRRR